MSHSLEELQSIFMKGQLPETFGIELTEVHKDSVVGCLTVDERHLRPGGIMNGGVSLVLLETIGSISSALHVDMSKFNAFGMQASANHTAVAKTGDRITARSKAVHIGRTTHVWDVEISNQLGKLISIGRITMMITERKT